MKIKTIKKILKAKCDEFVESVNNGNNRIELQNNMFITGGCIASMLLNDEVNDFDVYFKLQDVAIKIAQRYIHEMTGQKPGVYDETDEFFNTTYQIHKKSDGLKIYIPSSGIIETKRKEEVEENDGEKPEYKPIFISSNAITLTGKMQLIVRFTGSPDVIHSNYDFIHCTNYYDYKTDKLVLKQPALEALLTKTLKYVGSKYPICSIIRTKKFLKRGFTISAGEYLKMAYQVSKLNLDDIDVLRDQLTGVDSAYFDMLICALSGIKSDEYNNDEIGYEKISTLVDRIFG